MNDSEQKKLTFWGASPIIFITTILYAVAIIVINHFFRPVFEIKCVPRKVVTTAAIVLLIIGIALYVATLKVLKRAYRNKELITKGVFSFCRNPLFAVVIFMLLPGILLFFDSWLLLTIPVFMVMMFKLFIPREEALIESVFGQDYVDYKNNTPALIPRLLKKRK